MIRINKKEGRESLLVKIRYRSIILLVIKRNSGWWKYGLSTEALTTHHIICEFLSWLHLDDLPLRD